MLQLIFLLTLHSQNSAEDGSIYKEFLEILMQGDILERIQGEFSMLIRSLGRF